MIRAGERSPRAHADRRDGSRGPRLPQLQHRLPRRPGEPRSSPSRRRRSRTSTAVAIRPSWRARSTPRASRSTPSRTSPALIRDLEVDQVVFAYSDVSHENVMHHASQVLACGADFRLIGPKASMLKAKVPVVSVCAVRTGAGKSQTTRRVASLLRAKGQAGRRHPPPDALRGPGEAEGPALRGDRGPRPAPVHDRGARGVRAAHRRGRRRLRRASTTAPSCAQAQEEADVILWDGGNNDLPFYRPDLQIVVVDPHRPGHELTYHPGRGEPAPARTWS